MAMRVILALALIRSSIEDILLVNNLMNEINVTIDLREEIEQLRVASLPAPAAELEAS